MIQPLDIRAWAAQQLAISPETMQWQTLSGDASFRRYFRVITDDKRSYVAALAPPATEKNPEFVQVAALLSGAGIQVPKVIAVDYQHGYFLLSDLGQVLLSARLNASSVDAWYEKALQQLLAMQAIPMQA